MKHEKETGAKATVADYSNGADGSKTVDVTYDYEYDVIENETELREHFSTADLIRLANSRLKSTANSSARQKAVAPFAPDPNSPDVIKRRMLNDLVKLGVPEDVAKGMVESAQAAAAK